MNDRESGDSNFRKEQLEQDDGQGEEKQEADHGRRLRLIKPGGSKGESRDEPRSTEVLCDHHPLILSSGKAVRTFALAAVKSGKARLFAATPDGLADCFVAISVSTSP